MMLALWGFNATNKTTPGYAPGVVNSGYFGPALVITALGTS